MKKALKIVGIVLLALLILVLGYVAYVFLDYHRMEDNLPLTAEGAAAGEVKAGTADACVIDLLMAGAMIGEGTSYPDLTYTVELTSEEYGVGFRTGSDLAAALNDFFKASYADGSMLDIAKAYGVQESVIAK